MDTDRQHLDVCAKLILAAEKTDITCAAFGTSRDSWLLAGDEDTDSSFGGFRVSESTEFLKVYPH